MLKYVCMNCNETTFAPKIEVEKGFLVVHVKIHCPHCDSHDYHPVIAREKDNVKPKEPEWKSNALAKLRDKSHE